MIEAVSLSTIDMPGRSAVVLFVKGCPLHCPHCHNPGRGGCRDPPNQPVDKVRNLLSAAAPFVDGVVISGGEPTYDLDLTIELLRVAKGLGFRTGIETSGCRSDSLRDLMETGNLDEIYLDIKAPITYDGYKVATGVGETFVEVYRSLELCFSRFVPFWLRTVTFPDVPCPPKSIIDGLSVKYPNNKYRGWTVRDGRTG